MSIQGNVLLAASQKAAKLWNVAIESAERSEFVCTTKSLQLFPLGDMASLVDVCWDDQGSKMACAWTDGHVAVVDASTGTVLKKWKPGNASCKITFVKGSDTQLCCADTNVRVYDINSLKVLHQFELAHPSKVTAIASMLTRLVTATESGHAYTHSLRDNRTHQLAANTKHQLNAVACSSFKRWIAAVGDDGILCMWDINKGTTPFYSTSSAHSGPLLDVAFSHINKNAYCTLGADRKLKMHCIQDSGAHETVWEAKLDHEASSITMNGDSMIAAGTTDGKVVLYDIHWKTPLKIIDFVVEGTPVVALSFHPRAKLAAPISAEQAAATTVKAPLLNKDKSRFAAVQKEKNILEVFSPVAAGGKTVHVDNSTLSGVRRTNLTNTLLAASQSKADNKGTDTQSTQKRDIRSILASKRSRDMAEGRDTASTPSQPQELKSSAIGSSESLKSVRRATSEGQMRPSTTLKSTLADFKPVVPAVAEVNPQPSLTTPSQPSTGQSKPMESKSSSGKHPPATANSKDDVMDRVRRLLDRNKSRPIVSTDPVLDAPAPVAPNTHIFGGLVGSGAEKTPEKIEAKMQTTMPTMPVMTRPTVSMDIHSTKSSPAHESVKSEHIEVVEQHEEVNPRTAIATPNLEHQDFSTASPKGELDHKMVSADATQTHSVMEKSNAAGAMPSGSFQYQLIENVVEECMDKFKQEVRGDLLNVHLEVLKQFHEMRNEMERLVLKHAATAPLLDEIKRLREENDRLRRHF